MINIRIIIYMRVHTRWVKKWHPVAFELPFLLDELYLQLLFTHVTFD